MVERPRLWLFPSRRDPERALPRHTAHRIYHTAKDRAGITKAGGLHALRHAFATHRWKPARMCERVRAPERRGWARIRGARMRQKADSSSHTFSSATALVSRSPCTRARAASGDASDCGLPHTSARRSLAQCDTCGAQRYHYHSCRDRHCPKCQTLAKERWLAARRAELLPVPYFHLVFTLPHALNALAQGHLRVLYSLLFESVSATLIEFGANPRWLGGEIAATLILHTWGQTLSQHLHLHCLVAVGALHADGHWIHSRRGFLFPIQALSQVFRGKFLDALTHTFDAGDIKVEGSTGALADSGSRKRFVDSLRNQAWVVYAKQPFGGPRQVLDYLGRYTHRVALSNHRLVSLENGEVRFRYKDYAHGNRRKVMTLEADEFIRRFLLHVLPRGFMRIGHYGLLANRAKHIKRAALDEPAPLTLTSPPESVEAFGCA